ncbi:MAG: hypothetical protein LBQ90_00705 [Synergistaceae bacterium]|jgi:hypothetical protein|nr:hypothetical protein [Synergistaceae bacterium]
MQRGDPFASRGAEERDDGRGAEKRFEVKKRYAVEAGSMGYIWRSGCPRHKSLEGRFVPWNNPPLVDGVPVHAGERADCTCRTEIVH